METIPSPKHKAVIIYALGFPALALLVFCRVSLLFLSDGPFPIDSYFYLKEFQSYLKLNEGYYQVGFSFFYPLSLIGRFFSLDEYALYAFAVLACLVLQTAAVWIAASKKIPPSDVLLLIISIWGSELLFSLCYEFPRHGFALALLSLGFALLPEESHPSPVRARRCAFAFILWAASMHKLALCVGLLLLAMRLHVTAKTTGFRIAAAATALAIVVLGTEKQIVQFGELSFAPGWLRSDLFANLKATRVFEFLLQNCLFLAFSCRMFLRKTDIRYPLLFLALWFGLNLPVWDIRSHMAYRLAYTSVWALLWAAVTFVQSAPDERKSWIAGLLVSFCFPFAFLGGTNGPIFQFEPTLHRHKALLQSWVPQNGLILAPHGAQFRVSYVLERRAMKSLNFSNSEENMFRLRRWPTGVPKSCFRLTERTSSIPDDARCVSLGSHWSLEKQAREKERSPSS